MLEVDNTCDGRQLVYHSDPSCLTTARFWREFHQRGLLWICSKTYQRYSTGCNKQLTVVTCCCVVIFLPFCGYSALFRAIFVSL